MTYGAGKVDNTTFYTKRRFVAIAGAALQMEHT